MALKDCIRKMKGLVTKDDIALLEQYLADGLTDDEAVRKLLVEADGNVVSIAKRAQAQGAAIQQRPDFIGEIRSLQKKRAEKIREARRKYAAEETELNDTYSDSKTVIDAVKVYWNTLPENQTEGPQYGLDLYDDHELVKVLGSMLFNPNMRGNLNKGTFGLKGKTPLELLESFKALRDNQAKIRERLAELAVLEAEAIEQLNEIQGRKDTFYQLDQDELGFRSGLMTAVRIMPQEKGPADQMIAYLKKQPGVKKEELEWIDFESWAKAKGTVTRDEMIAYVEANGVEVLETQYGGPRVMPPSPQFEVSDNLTRQYREEDDLYTTVYEVTSPYYDDTFTVYNDEEAGNVNIQVDETGEWLEPLDALANEVDANRQNIDHAGHAIRKYIRDKRRATSPFAAPAEWETYTLPGGENYREIMLHLPTTAPQQGDLAKLMGEVAAGWRELPDTHKKRLDDVYRNRAGPPGNVEKPFLEALRTNFVKNSDFFKAGLQGYKVQTAFRRLEDARERKRRATEYTSHTFQDVKNILAWMRVKDRDGPNGEKILFVEEVQSDWHQEGRERGYATGADKAMLEKEIEQVKETKKIAYEKAKPFFEALAKEGAKDKTYDPDEGTFQIEADVLHYSDWMGRTNTRFDDAEAVFRIIGDKGITAIDGWRLASLELSAKERRLNDAGRGTPDAPFKGNAWAELAMKRVIRMAAEGGYDQIAWTTGEQQNERYDIGQQIESFDVEAWETDEDNLYGRRIRINISEGRGEAITVDNEGFVYYTTEPTFDGKHLSEIVGQEMADRLLQAEPSTILTSDITLEGEGMKAFYDRILVNITNKALKKLDKKAHVKKFGGVIADQKIRGPYEVRSIDGGLRWRVFDAEGQPLLPMYQRRVDAEALAQDQKRIDEESMVRVHRLDITADMMASAMEGQTLFQREKGSITFDEMRRGLIRLTEARDLSTFLHEAGHLYLETMRSLAEGPGAPQDIKDDWQRILDYLGVGAGREITREHHERFAESFEKYLSKGKAPSVYMQDAFNAFKRWMEMIPQKLRQLAGIELDESITGVFDRILASERQIAEAERVQEYVAIFSTPEDMGVSREVFDVYRKEAERAHQDSVDRETRRMMDFMRKDEQAWWKTEKAKVRKEVEAEAHQSRVYVALSMLQKGKMPDGSEPRMSPFKLDRDDLIDRYGKDFLKRLPKPWVYAKEGGVDTGVAAQALGYKSADELVQDLTRAPRMKDWINGETDQRMRDRFPDPMTDNQLTDNALQAVHNRRRASVLAAELRAMRAKAREDKDIVRATKETIRRERAEARWANAATLPKKMEIEQIRAGARAKIGALRVRDVRPYVYLNAERRAGKKAQEALARSDFQQGYLFKRQQIVNFEMYRAAVKAVKQNESTHRYLKKFEKTRVRQRMGKAGMLERIDAVLEGIELRKRSLNQIDYRKYLNSIKSMIEDGELVVHPDLAKQLETDGTNWQDLTVEQWAGIRDTVKQLEFLAKKQYEAIVNGETVKLEAVQNEIAEQIYGANKILDVGVSEETKREAGGKAVGNMVAKWLGPSVLARTLDQAGWGALNRHLMVTMRRGYAERLIPRIHTMQREVADLYRKHYSASEMARFKKRRRYEAFGEELSKSDVLSIALNWGSESNRNALLGGFKRNGQPAYTEEGVRSVLGTLDARDWAFVQDIWDYMDSYWPALRDAEQRRRGIAPEKIEALPFRQRTVDGKEVVVSGGYYPLVYDRRHSDRMKAVELEDLYKQIGNGAYVTANTRAGATYERTDKPGMVVRLGLGTIDTNLREVIRDVAIGDEVNFIKRVLNSSTVKNALYETNNEAAFDVLNQWLTDAAVGELPMSSVYESIMSWIRTGFTKSRLAFNALTTALQVTGVFQTMAVIGTVHYSKGLAKFAQNPVRRWKEVLELSSFMNARYEVGMWDKDVADTKAHLESFFGPTPTRLKTSFNTMSHYYYAPILRAQQVVDVTTWLAAFDKGRNTEGLSQQEAIHYADSQVELSQTSGFFSDRSALERGTVSARTVQSPFLRLWTVLIAYMLRKGNIAYMRGKETNFRSPKEVLAFIGDMVLLFTIEGIASALIYGRLPEDDEPEDLALWAIQKTGESVISGVPFVREIPGAMFGGGTTPVGALAHDMWDLGIQLSQGEADATLRRTFVNTIGTIGHLPASQTNRTLDAIWDEGDELMEPSGPDEWYELIVGERDE